MCFCLVCLVLVCSWVVVLLKFVVRVLNLLLEVIGSLMVRLLLVSCLDVEVSCFSGCRIECSRVWLMSSISVSSSVRLLSSRVRCWVVCCCSCLKFWFMLLLMVWSVVYWVFIWVLLVWCSVLIVWGVRGWFSCVLVVVSICWEVLRVVVRVGFRLMLVWGMLLNSFLILCFSILFLFCFCSSSCWV